MSKPRLVFFGNERLSSAYVTSAPTLRALVAAGYEICAVVANDAGGSGRSRKQRGLEIAAVAAEHGIPLLTPDRPADILEQLRGYSAQAGVLVAYGRIVPQSVIDVFPTGIINIHPSLLPLHRGSIPVESVILDGSAETGVSLMQLVRAMDAGPVYRQERLALRGDETKAALTAQLADMGATALLECLPAILDGSLSPTPQEDSQATYDQLLRPADGVMDFDKPATQLEREVRAYAGWPRSRTVLGGKDVVVTAAHVASDDEADAGLSPGYITKTAANHIAVTCGEGLLIIDRLQPAGKNEMDAAAFLAGNRL